MAFGTALAVYFIIWWITLFAVLPFKLRTQAEADSVTLGTTESAPVGPHMRRAALLTTVVSALIFGTYYLVTHKLGYSFADIPNIIPKFY
jgi:predicted secreted protein